MDHRVEQFFECIAKTPILDKVQLLIDLDGTIPFLRADANAESNAVVHSRILFEKLASRAAAMNFEAKKTLVDFLEKRFYSEANDILKNIQAIFIEAAHAAEHADLIVKWMTEQLDDGKPKMIRFSQERYGDEEEQEDEAEQEGAEHGQLSSLIGKLEEVNF